MLPDVTTTVPVVAEATAAERRKTSHKYIFFVLINLLFLLCIHLALILCSRYGVEIELPSVDLEFGVGEVSLAQSRNHPLAITSLRN